MNSQETEKKACVGKLEILLAIKAKPGITLRELREQLVLGKQGANSLDLYGARNRLHDEGLIKKTTDGFGHYLTAEGELWVTMRPPGETSKEPVSA